MMDESKLMICTTVAKLITNQGAVEYREVKVVQDDDGHNYVIPAELYERWSKLAEDSYSPQNDINAFEEFEREFAHFRTGGDLNLTLYAKVDYEKDEDF